MTFVPGPTLAAAWLIVTAIVALNASAVLRPSTISGWVKLAGLIWFLLQTAAVVLAVTL